MQIQPHPTQQQIAKARIAYIHALELQQEVLTMPTRLQVLRMQIEKRSMDNISQFLSSHSVASSSTPKKHERKERVKHLHAINSL